jgi:hypothetical protein
VREVSALQNIHDWVRLIESEFAEMAASIEAQAQRLWNLDASADLIFTIGRGVEFPEADAE